MAVTLTHVEAAGLAGLRNVLLELYAEARDVRPARGAALRRFGAHLDQCATAPDFDCVLAREAGEAVGYAFGYRPPSGARWWDGVPAAIDPGLRTGGQRVFTLGDIVVPERGLRAGVARAVHDELVAAHAGDRVVLLVDPARPELRARYEVWGYRSAGPLRQALPAAPPRTAMVRGRSAG